VAGSVMLSFSFHAHALSAHTRVRVSSSSTHLWLAPTLLLLHGAGTIDSDRPLASSWLHINMTKQINRIRDLTRYRVSWGSPLRVPFENAHMLSIDYQKYQIQMIKVINKTGHPAYWTRHIELSTVTWFVAANDWARQNTSHPML